MGPESIIARLAKGWLKLFGFQYLLPLEEVGNPERLHAVHLAVYHCLIVHRLVRLHPRQMPALNLNFQVVVECLLKLIWRLYG